MTFINKIWSFIWHNKYWIALATGILIIGFTGENSIMTHLKYKKQISDLEAEIVNYDSKYERDAELIKSIQLDYHTLTKIAREQYLMKADDEDIFIFPSDVKDQLSR
ncbi:MAG: septum formation initiator family protein [Bacteroidaceae bacterium]|nr:septum formation initiator family protein [Bacteroidaceae bacterium]